MFCNEDREIGGTVPSSTGAKTPTGRPAAWPGAGPEGRASVDVVPSVGLSFAMAGAAAAAPLDTVSPSCGRVRAESIAFASSSTSSKVSCLTARIEYAPDADCERPNEYAGHCVSYAKRCPCPLKARRQALHNQSACLFEATYIVGDATDITSWTILSIDVLARQKVVARHGRCKLRSNALGLAHAHCMEIRLLIIITIGICHNMHVPTIIIRIERLVIHNIHTHCGTRSLIMVRRCCRSIW